MIYWLMVRHLDNELQELKNLALQMGGCVEKALEQVCYSLAHNNSNILAQVHKYEKQINDLQIQVDEDCVNMLAKQAPVASDLRMVIAITRVNTDLERMGDQCVNIAHIAKDFFAVQTSYTLPADVLKMMDEVKAMVRTVLDAFARQDTSLCNKVLDKDDVVDDLKDTLLMAMRNQIKQNPDSVDFGLNIITIAKNLERLADHATNIAEEVIYLATGNDIRHGHTVAGSN
jgi:phosphate transport system protein